MNVTFVDCTTSHLWKPRLHEVAAGLIGAGEDETSYLAIGRANNFRFRLGALTALDPVAKTISISAVSYAEGGELLAARQLRYDTLVLAFGSQVNDFGVPGVVVYCHMLDSGKQALAFQRRLLELAVRISDGALDRLRVGIVGAGATGVELAAELHHAVSAMHRFGGLMSVSDLEITVVDMASRVLPNSDPATSEFAARTLERLGIAVRLNASVQEVTADGLVLKDGGLVPCDLKVWALGVIGRPVASTFAGLQLDRSRRIVCDDHRAVRGLPEFTLSATARWFAIRRLNARCRQQPKSLISRPPIWSALWGWARERRSDPSPITPEVPWYRSGPSPRPGRSPYPAILQSPSAAGSRSFSTSPFKSCTGPR